MLLPVLKVTFVLCLVNLWAPDSNAQMSFDTWRLLVAPQGGREARAAQVQHTQG